MPRGGRRSARPPRPVPAGSVADEDPGLLDPFFAPDAIAFVEWPEQGPGAWPGERVVAHVTLAHRGGDRGRSSSVTGDPRHGHRDAEHGGRRLGAGRGRARASRRPRRGSGPPTARGCSRSSKPRSRRPARAGGRSGGSPSASGRRLHRPAARDRDRAGARPGPRPAARRRVEPRRARPGAGDAAAGRTVLAAIDARRGEVFARRRRDGERCSGRSRGTPRSSPPGSSQEG